MARIPSGQFASFLVLRRVYQIFPIVKDARGIIKIDSGWLCGVFSQLSSGVGDKKSAKP